jgi:hypothetical protein
MLLATEKMSFSELCARSYCDGKEPSKQQIKKFRLEGKKPGNDLAEERIMPIFA